MCHVFKRQKCKDHVDHDHTGFAAFFMVYELEKYMGPDLKKKERSFKKIRLVVRS